MDLFFPTLLQPTLQNSIVSPVFGGSSGDGKTLRFFNNTVSFEWGEGFLQNCMK